ncbi:spermine/spermidine synthase [Anaeroplasma bactoclasticum]|jgi:spermidine synthase|uniref:Spermine/spermidine synthase n=1 Tax=Anaeroplasma bactoclasticum TaxID=2088 RepID=A0A397RUF4_9MOLU|nr:fused MFS/spermidine synthase [Anaeroplasma bactoclasticum]RIA75755.1 spermine/spermidine synthase [Anaeroplasma bactoclasticum]
MIFIAAAWICLIPVTGKYIIAGIALLLAASPLGSNFLVWAAFLSCLVVFVFPLLVLGMVTPNLIKFAVGNLNENGKVVGTIEALNTIGSIIGTFMPTFVTIPYIGTSLTFIIFAGVLFAICLVYTFAVRPKLKREILFSIFSLTIFVSSIFGAKATGIAFWTNSTIYEGESIYNYLRVEDKSDRVILSTNVLFDVQSIKMKTNEMTHMYYDYALAANSMVQDDDGTVDVLILGLGTGTFATESMNYYNNLRIDGVEIDQKIVDLAYEYFDLPKEVNAYTMDGRSYITNCDKKYDIIMVDAYQDITIPFQMSSLEFFTIVGDHLNPGGVMVVNMNMKTNKEGGIVDYLCGTIKNVFNNAYTVDCGTNRELFACNGFDLKESLNNNLTKVENIDLKNHLTFIKDNLVYVEDKPYILTDDKAPVELLGMDVLDDMIFDELEYYRGKLKGKSISEIIDMVMNGELF